MVSSQMHGSYCATNWMNAHYEKRETSLTSTSGVDLREEVS